MARSEKRKTKPHQPSPSPPANRRSRTSVQHERLSARGGDSAGAGEEATVRRSSVAPCVTCGLCGGILRDATTVSECLHSFCRKCIYQKFETEDIKCCPTCYTDLGCAPLEKLRVDHGLQHIRSTMFPTKKRKFEKISTLHPALVCQPSPLPGGDDYSTKKTGAYWMGEPMNSETGTHEKLGMEHSASPTKLSASILDRFRHLPLAITTNQERDEEVEITPNLFMKPSIKSPVITTSEKRDIGKLVPVSESVCGVRTCGITYRIKTPLTFVPPTPTRSGPPSTNERIDTALVSIPSNITHDKEVQVEVIKETSASQGLTHDFAALREAVAPDQTDPRQSQVTTVAPVPDQSSLKIQTNSMSSLPPATTVIATSDLSHIQTQFQYDKNLRSELFNICNQNSESLLQRIEAYISQSQVYKDVARLKEELENTRSEKAAAFERVRILEERLQEQTERLQSKSERSQQIMAAQEKLLQENGALKSEMARKDEDLTNLKHNNTMAEKSNIDVQKRNTVLEDRVGHVFRLLKAAKWNSRKLNKQLRKAINEKNKLVTELKTYNDLFAKIQGSIHEMLTDRLSILKDIENTIKIGHHEDLLSRINDLDEINKHLHKMRETIKIATSMSAYGPVAAIFVRLRAYHGDNFDLQRLLLPLHMDTQDYARIRNAVEPLAVEAAQKYGLNYGHC